MVDLRASEVDGGLVGGGGGVGKAQGPVKRKWINVIDLGHLWCECGGGENNLYILCNYYYNFFKLISSS